jgi:hypothetical protein
VQATEMRRSRRVVAVTGPVTLTPKKPEVIRPYFEAACKFGKQPGACCDGLHELALGQGFDWRSAIVATVPVDAAAHDTIEAGGRIPRARSNAR